MNYKKFGLVAGLAIVVIALGYISYERYYASDKATEASADTYYGYDNRDEVPVGSVKSDDYAENMGLNSSVKNNMHRVTISTNYGDIEFETYDADAPKTVENFISLANKGFYNGVIFHRVIAGFMIQGGDPTGTGRGGPGYTFADELDPNTESYKQGYTKGTVAMANAGPNTNGSQFFIMHEEYPLPNNYTIFGHVVKGQEVVDKIANVKTGPGDKPLEDVVMKSVKVEEVQ